MAAAVLPVFALIGTMWYSQYKTNNNIALDDAQAMLDRIEYLNEKLADQTLPSHRLYHYEAELKKQFAYRQLWLEWNKKSPFFKSLVSCPSWSDYQ